MGRDQAGGHADEEDDPLHDEPHGEGNARAVDEPAEDVPAEISVPSQWALLGGCVSAL